MQGAISYKVTCEQRILTFDMPWQVYGELMSMYGYTKIVTQVQSAYTPTFCHQQQRVSKVWCSDDSASHHSYKVMRGSVYLR